VERGRHLRAGLLAVSLRDSVGKVAYPGLTSGAILFRRFAAGAGRHLNSAAGVSAGLGLMRR